MLFYSTGNKPCSEAVMGADNSKYSDPGLGTLPMVVISSASSTLPFGMVMVPTLCISCSLGPSAIWELLAQL